MSPTVVAAIIGFVAYLIGSIPMGYLVGRAKGVNLFAAGSGNIGATNVTRVLGKGWGIFVFAFDFLKGAVPVAVAEPLARFIDPDAITALGIPDLIRVGAAVAAFAGHLFPVYLGFRGGKGVATGAGAVLMVAPVPTIAAALAWIAVALASRVISLASLTACGVLVAMRLLTAESPWGLSGIAATLFCVAGVAIVVFKHRTNIRKLLAGTENHFGDSVMRRLLLNGLHCLAVGLWFGGAAFFNFTAAPSIFASFERVVHDAPSDRTAGLPLLPAGADAETKKKLASALAGAAVGPIFPKYFTMMAICGLLAVVTASVWRRDGRLHRVRLYLLSAALLLVIAGWPISDWVTSLRLERLSADHEIAERARGLFGPVHLVSLALSLVGNVLTGIGLFLAGRIPQSADNTAPSPS